ncbi:MAG TPA: FAD-dependent oxidoreductase, partial [Gammaproteobacteria bacterium]|nr:FAD-dependent oxidoreductase [Gammaproteobacteria bacterium]
MNRRGFVRGSLAAAIGASSLSTSGAFGAILSPSKAVDADINAVTGAGKSVTLKKAAVQELGESLRGNLLLPGHPAYDDARRVLNASISKFPALIVQPRGVADVRRAVDFARESSLLVAVKCGGHSHSGKSTCDGGLMIDLSLMRGVRVDERERIAYVSGGSLLGDMDNETMQFGLVTSAGTVSHTGVAGLTLGGGFGRVARRFGLSLDNLRAVDVVTADGRLVHASADENAELL